MKSIRRTFLKTFAYTLAGSFMMGRETTQWLVGSAHAAQGDAGELRIDLTQFPALQNPNGSVRLALNPFTTNRANGAYYPIIVNRTQNGSYVALNSRCTHADCVVEPFNSGSNSCICPCHGSRFSIDGRRLFGPASRDLERYNVREDGEEFLVIEVPGLNYSVEMNTVSGPAGNLIELSFPSQDRVRYEVLFRSDLQTEWTAVPFGTSSNGPFNVMETSGNGSSKSVFVQPEGQRGFYSVAVIVIED